MLFRQAIRHNFDGISTAIIINGKFLINNASGIIQINKINTAADVAITSSTATTTTTLLLQLVLLQLLKLMNRNDCKYFKGK